MNKKSLMVGWTILALVVGGIVYAGSTGIGDTDLVSAKVKKIVNILDTILSTSSTINGETIADDTIDDDSIDFTDVTVADLLVQVGTCTNAQAITFSPVFAVVPQIVVEQTHATSNAYFTSVTTSNATAVVPGAGTNKWMAIPRD